MNICPIMLSFPRLYAILFLQQQQNNIKNKTKHSFGNELHTKSKLGIHIYCVTFYQVN